MSDAGEHAGTTMQRRLVVLLLVGCSTIIAMAVGVLLHQRGEVGLPGFFGVVLLGPVVGLAASFLVWQLTGVGSRGLVTAMTGAGNLRRAPSYSLQESLIARGRFEEAEQAFEVHLGSHPEDLDARLALAALVRDHRRDPARAERLFLEARAGRPTRDQEFTIANALIDLYRTTGQAGREMTELARFAERYDGTEAGRPAREALRRLKAAG